MRVGIDLCGFNAIHAGGKDEVAYNLLRGFEILGHSKQIVCFCHADLVDIVKEVNKNVEIVVVPKVKLPDRIKAAGRLWDRFFLEKKIRELGLKVLVFTNKKTPWKKFSVNTIFIPHDIQVFESGKIPGVYWSKSRYWVLTTFMKLDFYYNDHIVAISDYDKNAMIQYMPWAEKKIHRIYNPIRFFDYPEEKNEKKYITAINIQWRHKNTETLVDAYAKMADKTDLDLMLVGRKPYEFEELEKRIKHSGVEERIHFSGFVTEEEMNHIIAKTRVYVNPSYYEGFGMTAVEMMGRKIPTITSTATAIPEVTNGMCRYYEPVDDSEALAKTLLEELENPTSEEQLETIAQNMRDRYEYIHIAKQYWDLFEQVAAEEVQR